MYQLPQHKREKILSNILTCPPLGTYDDSEVCKSIFESAHHYKFRALFIKAGQ